MESDQTGQHGTNTPPATVSEPDRLRRTAGVTHRDRMSPEEVEHEAVTRANAPRSHQGESSPAQDDTHLRRRLGDLPLSDLDRLTMLKTGATLEQGSVYVDLDDPARRPFKALGGETAEPGQRLIAKRETDFELWNRLVPADRGEAATPTIERPDREAHGVENRQRLEE